MSTLARLGIAPLFLLLFSTAALAGGPSPVGSWQSADGQARVRVTMCGDGTALCARLIGLSGDARTRQNLRLLNTYVVEQAARADTNVWQGTFHFNGQTARGEITLRSAGQISVSGCQMGMCKTFQFVRVSGNAVAASAAAELQIPPRTVGLTLPE